MAVKGLFYKRVFYSKVLTQNILKFSIFEDINLNLFKSRFYETIKLYIFWFTKQIERKIINFKLIFAFFPALKGQSIKAIWQVSMVKVLIECSLCNEKAKKKYRTIWLRERERENRVEAVKGVRNKTIIMKLLCKHITTRWEKGKKQKWVRLL